MEGTRRRPNHARQRSAKGCSSSLPAPSLIPTPLDCAASGQGAQPCAPTAYRIVGAHGCAPRIHGRSHRIRYDPQWRQQLIDNPQQALDRAAFPLSDEERRVITSTTREDREEMMQQLIERTSLAVWSGWSVLRG